MIEHTTQLQFYPQDGLIEMAKGLDYKAARVYSIPKDEQAKLKLAEAVERWGNTDEERNIRINLLRIYDKPAAGMLGVGVIVGTGIFVLTGVAAAKYAGPALMLSFIIASITCGFVSMPGLRRLFRGS